MVKYNFPEEKEKETRQKKKTNRFSSIKKILIFYVRDRNVGIFSHGNENPWRAKSSHCMNILLRRIGN